MPLKSGVFSGFLPSFQITFLTGFSSWRVPASPRRSPPPPHRAPSHELPAIGLRHLYLLL
jgi:hypothetical protein